MPLFRCVVMLACFVYGVAFLVDGIIERVRYGRGQWLIPCGTVLLVAGALQFPAVLRRF